VPAAGTALPAGVHTISYTVTDSKGASMSCAYKLTVKVIDPCANATALKITCPRDTVRTVAANSGTSATPKTWYVNYPLPIITGGCGRTSITSTPSFGTPLPAGEHTITYTVKDAKGAVATCAFKLTIKQALTVRSAAPSDVTIYPNPANQYINIGFNGYESQSPVAVHIYNTLGLEEKRFDFNALNGEPILLSVESLTSGYHIIKVVSADGTLHITRPIMISND
jgi:hypothetical protein